MLDDELIEEQVLSDSLLPAFHVSCTAFCSSHFLVQKIKSVFRIRDPGDSYETLVAPTERKMRE